MSYRLHEGTTMGTKKGWLRFFFFSRKLNGTRKIFKITKADFVDSPINNLNTRAIVKSSTSHNNFLHHLIFFDFTDVKKFEIIFLIFIFYFWWNICSPKDFRSLFFNKSKNNVICVQHWISLVLKNFIIKWRKKERRKKKSSTSTLMCWLCCLKLVEKKKLRLCQQKKKKKYFCYMRS